MNQTLLAASQKTLQQQVTGSVLVAGDPGYDQARSAWDLTIDQHPALILIADNINDIIAGVRLASETGMGVATQSTGHGILVPADDNLLIVTSRLKTAYIDPATRTARVAAGVAWKQILDLATPYKLAPLMGSTPYSGIVGYTLGGGIGWLARQYGYAADSVNWIDVVTADGFLRHTSPTENSDLFQALRGGGGSFGIVTALEFALYEVPEFYGGTLVYSGELATSALRFFRDWIMTVPDELTSSITILKYPSFDVVPAPLRGQLQVFVRIVLAKESVKGRTCLQAWRDWHIPLSDTLHTMPFAEIGIITNDPVGPSAGYITCEMFDTLSNEASDVIIRHMADPASPLNITELRHLGGALARTPAFPDVIGNRQSQLILTTGGIAPTPESYAGMETYAYQYKEALRPYLNGGVYLNFLKGREARNRVRDAYSPEIYDKLVSLKKKYDPKNVFRFNYQFIPD